MTQRRQAVALALACTLALGTCTIPTSEEFSPTPTASAGTTPTTSTTLVPDGPDLQAAVDNVLTVHGGTAGLAVPDGSTVEAVGNTEPHPAWSTIKVPLAVATLRTDPGLMPVVTQAIRVSDNAAADALWAAAGADGVDAVLAEGQAESTVSREILRPEYSIFGQTAWTVADQVRFVAHLPCLPGAGPVLEDMAHIDPSQTWGLGMIPGARFKCGWGPTPPVSTPPVSSGSCFSTVRTWRWH